MAPTDCFNVTNYKKCCVFFFLLYSILLYPRSGWSEYYMDPLLFQISLHFSLCVPLSLPPSLPLLFRVFLNTLAPQQTTTKKKSYFVIPSPVEGWVGCLWCVRVNRLELLKVLQFKFWWCITMSYARYAMQKVWIAVFSVLIAAFKVKVTVGVQFLKKYIGKKNI